MINKISSAAFADTKTHYNLLDGLRGIAALLVIWYHIFEGFAFASNAPLIEILNHGYLAVDFFFMLSGFVISYAYDDRLKKSMSLKTFFTRRLIRLHPMVILGSIIGAITFALQGCIQWNGTSVSTFSLLTALLCSFLLIPALPGMPREIRGNGEMFPLNGPSWSLFFEYIGNILYALIIQRLSNKLLTIVTAFLGILLTIFTWGNLSNYGNIGVGWTFDTINILGGSLRMLFPFTMGMLLARNFKPINIKGGFWICATLLFFLFAIPYIPGNQSICINGIYESFCLIIVFPIIVWLGASSTSNDRISAKIYHFLGDISYPIYIIHYPIMYLFYDWLIKKQIYTLNDSWPIAVGIFIGNILLAYISLKFYDEPTRNWLTRHLLKK